MTSPKNIKTFLRNAANNVYRKIKKNKNDNKQLLSKKTEVDEWADQSTKRNPRSSQFLSEGQETPIKIINHIAETQPQKSVDLIDFETEIQIPQGKKNINKTLEKKKEEIRKKILERVDKVKEKTFRKNALVGKWKYAAKEFSKAGTRSDHPTVPKEQQVSIDLDNKMLFDHENNRLIKNPPMYETSAYIREVGN